MAPTERLVSLQPRSRAHPRPPLQRPPPLSARIEDLMKDGSTASCPPAKQIGSVPQPWDATQETYILKVTKWDSAYYNPLHGNSNSPIKML